MVGLKKESSDALREVKIKYMERSTNTCTMLLKSERIDPKINDKDVTVWRLQFKRFSNLIRLQAWVMRFVSNSRVGENRRLLDCELQCEEL